jgi:hypothetical protein
MDIVEALAQLGIERFAYGSYSELPFRHWIIDGLLSDEALKLASQAFPLVPAAPEWVVYDNPLEKKRTLNKLESMPDEIRRVIYELNSKRTAERVSELTDIAGLAPDPMLHGGGMHAMLPGDFLWVHLDHSHNPNGLERRLSMILFVNEEWHEDWGGSLEFFHPDGRTRLVKIVPKFNRAVLWESADNAFHGVTEPIRCPAETYRKTLAIYYLSNPRPGIAKRDRAMFVPLR